MTGFSEGAPAELITWRLVERFGWSYEQAENLPQIRYMEYMQILDAQEKAKKSGFSGKGK